MISAKGISQIPPISHSATVIFFNTKEIKAGRAGVVWRRTPRRNRQLAA